MHIRQHLPHMSRLQNHNQRIIRTRPKYEGFPILTSHFSNKFGSFKGRFHQHIAEYGDRHWTANMPEFIGPLEEGGEVQKK